MIDGVKTSSASGTPVTSDQAEKIVYVEGWRQEAQYVAASLASV